MGTDPEKRIDPSAGLTHDEDPGVLGRLRFALVGEGDAEWLDVAELQVGDVDGRDAGAGGAVTPQGEEPSCAHQEHRH